MLPLEHSSIRLTIIKIPFVTKIFVLSIFEWPLKTGFTVLYKLFQLTFFFSCHDCKYWFFCSSKTNYRLMHAGQKYCRMLPFEHSAILLTIKLPFVTKIFVLSIFEWRLKTDLTVLYKLFSLTFFFSCHDCKYWFFCSSKTISLYTPLISETDNHTFYRDHKVINPLLHNNAF